MKIKRELVVICLALFFFSFISLSGQASATWFDPKEPYKMNVTINNTQNSNTLTNYQVALNITYNAHMNSDCSDLRIVNGTENTALDYWIEAFKSSSWCYVWVKVDNIPASSYATIFVYYGNSTYSTTGKIWNAMDFGDDFSGASINTTNWGSAGTVTQTGTGLVYVNNSGSRIYTNSTTFLTGASSSYRFVVLHSVNSTNVGNENTCMTMSDGLNQNACSGATVNKTRDSFWSDGNIYAESFVNNVKTGDTVPIAYSSNTFYRFEEDVNYTGTGSIDYYVNNSYFKHLQETHTTNVPKNAMGLHIGFQSGASVSMAVKYAFITKFSSPEPTSYNNSESTYSAPSDTTPPLWNYTAGYLGSTSASIQYGGSNTLYDQGKDETNIDLSWLETNESGSYRNKTDVFSSTNSMNDSTTTKNFTWTTSGNKTFWIKVPRDFTSTSILNMTGYGVDGTISNSLGTANDICHPTSTTWCSAYFTASGNTLTAWKDTFSSAGTGRNLTLRIRSTLTGSDLASTTAMTSTVNGGTAVFNFSSPVNLTVGSGYYGIFSCTNGDCGATETGFWSNMTSTSYSTWWVNNSLDSGSTWNPFNPASRTNQLTYQPTLTIQNYTSNFYLDELGDGTKDFSQSSYFLTQNSTIDFSSTLSSYLKTCSPDSSNNCNVSFVMHSDSNGVVNISSINITYLPYTRELNGTSWNWTNYTWTNSSITNGATISWRIWYNDTSNNLNMTSYQNFTLGGLPQFSSQLVSPSSPQTFPVDPVWFNISISETGGNISKGWLRSNLTGSYINYTMSNDSTSHYYYKMTKPPAEDLSYQFFANDTSGSENSTSASDYLINKASTTATLNLNPSSPINFGTTTNASCTENNPEIGGHLYRNSVLKDSENNTFIKQGAGTWTYVCNSTATQNYSSSTSSSSYTVNQISPTLSLYGVTNGTFNFSETIYTISNDPEGLSVSLVKNGTSISNNTAITYGSGLWNITSYTLGDQNYTSASTSSWNLINQASISLYLAINGTQANVNMENGSYSNVTGWKDSTLNNEGILVLTRNGAGISNPDVATYDIGTYNFTLTLTAQNYTASPVARNLTIFAHSLMFQGVYDENTLLPICYNFYMFNQSMTYNSSSCGALNMSWSILPNGLNEVTVTNMSNSSSSYIPRNYYINIVPNSSVTFTGYLLKSTDGVYITTLLYGVSPASNITTEALRYINNSWTVVEQKLTDPQGKGYFFLYPYTQYEIIALTTPSVIVDRYYPNPQYPLLIGATASGVNSSTTWIFDNTTVSLTPSSSYINKSVLTPIAWKVSVPTLDLSYYGLRIYRINGTSQTLIYQQQINSSTSGGEIDVNLNSSVNATRYDLVPYFKRTNYDEWNTTKSYFNWFENSYLPNFLTALNTGGLGITDPFTLLLVAVFISMVGGAFIGRGAGASGMEGSGTIGGAIGFVLIMIIFVYIGWFSSLHLPFGGWEIITLMGLIAVGIGLARRLF